MRRASVCVFAMTCAAVMLVGPAAAQAVPSAGPANAPLATWQAEGRVSALAIAGGVVYLGGSFTTLTSHGTRRTVTRDRLAAIDESTGKPTGWNPGANGPVHALRVIGNRVYVGGSFTSVGGHPFRNLAVVSRTTGRVLTSFHGSADGEVDAMAASATRLYIGGAFSRADGTARRNVAALGLSGGGLASAWRASANGPVHVLLDDSAAGRIFVGGHFTTVDGAARPFLAAIGSRGGSVFRWHTAPLGQVWALALGPTSLYAAVGGHEGGQLDAFDPGTGGQRWSRFADGDVQAVALAGGEVLAGGHFLNACGDTAGAPGGGSPWVCTVPVQRDRFFATDENGAIQSWDPGANSLYGVWARRADATHVVAGGDFTLVDGAHQARYAEFLR
jgi:outer membrane protein assembly factor BamB